jgi:hypothetical protein
MSLYGTEWRERGYGLRKDCDNLLNLEMILARTR